MKQILFKINGAIALIEHQDLPVDKIEDIKISLMNCYNVEYDDLEVIVEDIINGRALEMSQEIDMNEQGLIFWRDTFFKPIYAVTCDLVEGSDKYMDAVADGSIINHLHFVR